MSRTQYSKRESRQRGWAALVMSLIAVALLAGTWLYIHWQLSEGRHAHVALEIVGLDAIMPLVAGWLVWDWARYRRGLKVSNQGERRRHGGRKRRRK